ncbi:MAG: hypothetical protein ABH862_06940 [Candidatus Omnitrophota bacterium]
MGNRKLMVCVVISALLLSMPCYAQKSSSDILKEGLLGAGAGAVGGAASGAKGGDLWKGALAGAGVNVVGGALLDSISGEPVRQQSRVQQMPSDDAYKTGYQDGYTNGYKTGYAAASNEAYSQGYRDAINDMRKEVEPEKKTSWWKR